MPDPVPTSAHPFALQVNTCEKVREKFAGEKVSGMEHGRSDRKPETGHPCHRRPATFKNELVRQKMDDLTQKVP